jgi:lipopolysaccharide biosynthesis protein
MSDTTAFIFAHYSPRGGVSRSFRGLVAEARRRSKIVKLISTGLEISSNDQLYNLADVVRRDNFGYDFWSYRIGVLDVIGNMDVERLVLINSSFVAFDAKRLFDSLLQPIDVPRIRGLTLSHDFSKHAQSYLLSIEGKALIQSPEFNDWWSSMVPISDRNEVIQRYEIGLSRSFEALGIPITSVYQPSNRENLIAISRAVGSLKCPIGDFFADKFTINLDFSKTLNPTHFLWDFIFQRFLIFKTELVKSNPTEQCLDRLITVLQERKEWMEITQEVLNLSND